jgi:hypothetical protein
MWRRAVVLSHDAHLIDDKAVAKMGHPAFVVNNCDYRAGGTDSAG